jgi:hypothetical protein
MPDLITGVLVLQKMPEPEVWACWFEYTRHDGTRGISYIPMVEKGRPHPPGHTGPLWQFVRRNPWLDCSPSVRILGPNKESPDHFHNEGAWSNHYVQMTGEWGSEPEGRELCWEINGFGQVDKKPITKEFRDSIILPYRAKGVLL